MDKRDIIRLHTASMVEIEPLRAFLEDKGITTMVRDEYSAGLNAGFVSGIPNAIDIYVLNDDYEDAIKLLDEFLSE